MASSTQEPTHDPTAVSGAAGDDGARSGHDNADSRSDNGSASDHVGEKRPPEPKLTKKEKVKRHCGKFKWWYLIGNVIFLAILLPILFKVILPAIVQLIVNQQKIPIDGGGLYALNPNTLSISLDTKLKSPLPATIDPWQLFLYQRETEDFSPFANITLPKAHIKGQTPIKLVNQTAEVTNMTELISWFDKVFDEETVKLSVKGKSTIHLSALSSVPHLDKTVELPGLRGLQGFQVTDLNLMMPPKDNGNNIKGTVRLPNWGKLTIGLGNLTFNLVSGKEKIGIVTVYEVTLPPGNSTKNFEGQLYLNHLFTNLGAILESQAEPIGRGQVQLNFTGNTTILNGEHLKFFEAVLNKRTLSSEISLLTLISDVLSGFLGAGGSGGDSKKGDHSIVNILTDVLGNTTLVEEVLGHWNQTGDVGKPKFMKREANGPATWNLFKLGLRMAMMRKN